MCGMVAERFVSAPSDAYHPIEARGGSRRVRPSRGRHSMREAAVSSVAFEAKVLKAGAIIITLIITTAPAQGKRTRDE